MRWKEVEKLYFKKIEMHGFKSFAEPVTIDFNEGITCIVGPNGSGKSNISDAIRWVLGEQSPKTLRGGKMEDVIFAGTASRKSRGMAEVTIVIDNKTGILPIDFSEVAITRRMYRSGESEYSINNSHCRLRDIRELIMDTGIGVDGYSLIGQGKIADIVSNKSESRREIFEEAAGIVKYRSKKTEAERKLEATNVNLERVNDIVSEIEGRIGNLKDESIKAREYIGLRETFKDLEINITLKNIENVELKNEYIKDEISEASVNIDEVKDEKILLDKELSSGRERNEELEKLNNESRDKLLVSIEQINSLVNQTQLNQEKLATMGKDNERLEGEIKIIQVKLSTETTNLENLGLTKNNLEKKLTALELVLNAGIKNYADMTEKLSKEAEEIDEKKNNIYRLHSSVSTKTAEKNSLLSLKATLDRRKEVISFDKNEYESSNKDTLFNFDKAEEEKKIIEEKFQTVKLSLIETKEQYNEAYLREKQLANELESIKFNIGQLSSRKKTIEEMESNYEGYNGAVKFIMKSQLKGIHGVIGELITVPSGFETAIETSLGAALQNMVCEDDSSAQSAILSLKENKAGRLKLGDNIEAANAKKTEILETLDKLRNRIEKDVSLIQNLDVSIRETELNLVSKNNEILALEKILNGLTSNQGKWLRELNSIEEEKTGADKMISEIDKYAEKIKEEIIDTEGKIENYIQEYEFKKRQLEIINEEIIKARIDVNSCESEKNNLESIVDRIKSSVQELSYEESIKESALAGLEKEKENLISGHVNIEDVVAGKEAEKNNLEEFISELIEERGKLNSSINEKAFRKDTLEEELSRLQSQKYELEIKQAKNETQLEGYKDKLWEEFEVSYIKAIEFKKKEFSMGTAVKESREIKNRMKELGEVNIGSIKEYDAVSERYEFLTVQRDDIVGAIDSLRKIIEDMDKIIRARFKESFDKV